MERHHEFERIEHLLAHHTHILEKIMAALIDMQASVTTLAADVATLAAAVAAIVPANPPGSVVITAEESDALKASIDAVDAAVNAIKIPV